MCAGRLGKGCALALYRVQDQAGRLAPVSYTHLIIELADDLIHVRNAVDNGLCGNAVLERFTGVERACNTCLLYTSRCV